MNARITQISCVNALNENQEKDGGERPETDRQEAVRCSGLVSEAEDEQYFGEKSISLKTNSADSDGVNLTRLFVFTSARAFLIRS